MIIIGICAYGDGMNTTASSVVVFEAQHLEILGGGTSSKVGNILLTEKHLELLGEDQLTLRSFRGGPV